MRLRIVLFGTVLTAVLIVPLHGTRSTFVPDWTFKGSTLTGWKTLGQADWRAADGELIGTPKSPEGGWLVLDRSFQDVEFGADFKCTEGCKTGVLLRAEKTQAGMKGVFVSLTANETGSFAVTLDGSGRELTRARLRPAGGMVRFAPPPPDDAAGRAGGAGQSGHRVRRRGRGVGARCYRSGAGHAGRPPECLGIMV